MKYVSAHRNITITCKIHGDFEQQPNNHLHGKGCNKCGEERTALLCRSNTKDFITKANQIHDSKYSYGKVDYTNNNTNITITCKLHGDFPQQPNNHLSGQGCYKCARERIGLRCRSNTKDFIEKANIIHDNKYSYETADYVTSQRKITITCKKHGDFEQQPNNHLHGNGCPSCINKTENKLYNALGSVYDNIVQQFTAEWCVRTHMLRYDFCIPEDRIIIELDGAQHFRQVSNWQSCEETVENDRYKSDCANRNNYSVIRLLQEDVWDDKYNWTMELHNAIKKIRASSTVMNIYLCKNDEYADHTAL